MQKNTPVPHLNKGISCQEKGDKTAVLSRLNKGVAKFRSVAPRASDLCTDSSHTALDCDSNNPSVIYARLVPSGSPYIES